MTDSATLPAVQVSGRDDVIARAMPMVLRVEKAAPPTHTDALEAAAAGCLALLADPRRHDAWAEQVDAWLDGRFRKVARRARGGQWDATATLDHVEVTVRTATVRVFVPTLVADTPQLLRRLQVSGLELPDPAPAPAPAAGASVVWVNPSVPMSTGKLMAQVGHVACMLAEASGRFDLPIAVRTATRDAWADLLATSHVQCRDAGFTEVPPGTCTAVGTLPVS